MTLTLLAAKILVVLLVMVVTLAVARKWSASWRCTVARLGFWSLALLPVADLWGPQWLLRVLPLPRGEVLIFNAVPPPPPPAPSPWVLAAWGVLAFGAVVGVVWLLFDLARLAYAIRRCEPFRQSVSARSRVIVSAQVDSPFTVGFFRPVIVLPESAYEWSEDRLHSVLAHEEAHVRRLDWAQFIAMRLVVAVFWPNLILRWLDRAAHIACEEACDDEVLREGISGPTYARHLLGLAQAPGRPMFPTAAMAAPCALEARVRGVLLPTRPRTRVSQGSRIAAFTIGALTVIGLGGLTLAPASIVSVVIPGTGNTHITLPSRVLNAPSKLLLIERSRVFTYRRTQPAQTIKLRLRN